MITNIKLWKKSNIFLFGYKYFGNNNISVSSKNVQHNVWTSAISASKDSIPFSDTGEKPANNLMFKTRLSKSEIQNFRKILRECGINVRVDKRMYNIITGSSIAQLKSEGILADSTNVQLMLIKQFKDIIGLKVDLLAFNDSMKIDTIRLHIAQLYLKEVLAVDDDEFELLFKNQYNSILSKPLSTLKEVFELLTLEYQLSSEQIKQNIRLLKLNPDVLRDPLKFKKYAWDIIVGSAMKQAQPWKFGRHQYYRPNCNEILQECGFSGKDKNYSKELQQILYTPVGVLKKMGYIPPELDVPKRLMELFTDTALSLEGQHFDDSMPLGTVRYFILKRYMETATNTTHDEFTKLQHYKILCKPFGQPSKGAEPWLPYRRENVNNEFYKQILTECGSKPDCDKYVYIMQTSIKRLKEMGYIPFELDVAKHLASQVPEFKLPIEKYDFKDTMRLGTVRYFFLRMFINALVNIKDEEHDLLFKRVHRMVLTRSISGIRDIYTFLTQEFGIEQSILQQKLYMLSYDLQTAQTFLNMKTLVGIDVRIIAKKRPWVFEKDIRNFLKIIELLRSFNIPESRISLASYSILLHQPDIVHQRLTSLVNNDILNVYVGHPSFLYIILRYNRVMARLECMKLVPKRKVSLHFLVQEDEETFIRQLKYGMRPSSAEKWHFQYFANFFGKSLSQTERAMNQHPHSSHFSIAHLKKNVDYLEEAGFSREDIFNVFYITPYPKEKIMSALKQTEDVDFVKEQFDADVRKFDKGRILKLCVLIMEDKHDFSGDGCWPDDKSTELIDFPDEDTLREILNKYKVKKRMPNKRKKQII